MGRRFLTAAASVLVLGLLAPAIAHAQQGFGVQQQGAVTANDCTTWAGNNKIKDAGAECSTAGGDVSSSTVTTGPGPTMASLANFLYAQPPVYATVTCDGVTDVASAVNALLTTYAGFNVVLPKGTCYVGSAISVPSFTTLSGAARGSTIIKTSATATYPGVEILGTATLAAMRHFSVNGNASAAGNRAAEGVRVFNGATLDQIEDVEAYGAGGNGIEDDGSYDMVFNSYVHGNYNNGIYQIGTVGTPANYNQYNNNIVVSNSVGSTTWDGIDIDPCSNYTSVTGNKVYGNDIIKFDTTASCSGGKGNSFIGNLVVSSPENGMRLDASEVDLSIVGNTIISPTGWGIALDGAMVNVTISGNTIDSPTKDGIEVYSDGGSGGTTFPTGAPNLINISGGAIQNPGTGSSAGTYSAIKIVASATNVTVGPLAINDANSLMAYAFNGAAAASCTVVGYFPTGQTGSVNKCSTMNPQPASGGGTGADLSGGVSGDLVDFGSTGVMADSGTALSGLALLAGTQTFTGAKTFGALIAGGATSFTSTSLPTQAAGTLGAAGTASTPTMGANAEGDAYLTSANGLNLIGDGSTNDIALRNDAGTLVAGINTAAGFFTTGASFSCNNNSNFNCTFNGGSSTGSTIIGNSSNTGKLTLAGLAASSSAQTGTLCLTSGNIVNYDTTTTCLLSDLRDKEAIRPLDAGLAEIMALKPISYDVKASANPALHALGRQVGLGAQDVAKVDPRLVSYYRDCAKADATCNERKGTPSGVRYEQLTAVLIKAVQDQQAELASERRTIRRQQAEIDALRARR